jgi:hypothetical protein
MRFYLARSARRHRIGKAHALAALQEPYTVLDDGAFERFAPDDRGVELHILGHPADEDPNLVVIYHVQPTTYTHQKGDAS